MFRSTGNFDKLLDKATSHLLMEPDWNSTLQLCDLIRQKDVQPKHALNALKPKLSSVNQHQALYALLVLESMVKNCGYALHEELTTRPFCDFLYELTKSTPHEKGRAKLLELIQAWNFAFRKNPKHGALKDIMNAMKSDGFKFPQLRESDAMFTADSAPEWSDGEVCSYCRTPFTLIQRKHHCRACGQVFCGQCSSKTTTLPKYGIEKEVRVCDNCYQQAHKPSSASSRSSENDLPAEYVNSSLAQQSQAPPPRKSEDELREEEELQLALAISQSEAEAKEKEKKTVAKVSTTTFKERTPSPVEEASNPELAKYLDRSYWESLHNNENNETPSAPVAIKEVQKEKTIKKENGVVDADLEEFVRTLRSQVEIFINRMKSNSSRGRSIANDTSVQTLFLNITAMHSRLFGYIQQHDDSRLHYERLQDKLTQVKDARAALDDLREEHREKLRREAEEAERQRQLQMAHKLEIMRKKKQEYLQYQRHLALQSVQEKEREMQVRQEQQKQQYLMGYMGAPAFGGPPPMPPPQQQQQPPFAYPMGLPQMAPPPPQAQPQFAPQYGIPPGMVPMPQQYPPIPQHTPQPQPQQPPPQAQNGKQETTTAELISFD